MDLSEYKDMFEAEAREYLQSLNSDLLAFEKNPENRSLLDEMFRAAHSLKGMCGTMGYEELAELTHSMENALESLRSDEIAATSDVINVLFEALDILEAALEATIEERPVGDLGSISDKLAHLDDVDEGDDGQGGDIELELELDEFEKELVKQAGENTQNVYKIRVRISEDCLLKSVRAYMVLQALEKQGSIVKTVPTAQELEDEEFDQEFMVLLLTDRDAAEIEQTVLGISEIASVSVRPLTTESRANAKAKDNEPAEVSAASPSEMRAGNASKEVPSQSNPKVRSHHKGVEKFIRVETERLDSLIDLVGELVISRTQVVEMSRQVENGDLMSAIAQLERITTDLHYAATKLRMVAIKQVFDRFPRMVRDLAKASNKKIDLVVEGETTELDRSIVNQIGDPLVHALRNAVDHGIESPEERVRAGKPETGTIRLTARHEGSHVVIEIADDGKGIDVEAVRRRAVERGLITAEQAERLNEFEAIDLIFEPGFSTAEEVTDVSGRGVGMDAVKAVVESLQGSVEVKSKRGKGTTLTIRLPLTLAIIQALLIRVDGEVAAVPIHSVRENLHVDAGQVRTVQGARVIRLRDEVLPLLDLASQLGFRAPVEKDSYRVIVTEVGEAKVGFIVDALLGQQEVVIKSLPKILGDMCGVAGATVLGNGKVALILDTAGLVDSKRN